MSTNETEQPDAKPQYLKPVEAPEETTRPPEAPEANSWTWVEGPHGRSGRGGATGRSGK